MRECPTCNRCYADEVLHCPDDTASTFSSIPGPPIIEGRYGLKKRLGQGSMGVVFEAFDILLNVARAIKIFLPELVGDDPVLKTRFLRCARAAAAIRHPNVVAVSDYGIVNDVMPFLVMDLVTGPTLHDILARQGSLEPRRAWEIAYAIAAGLNAAHEIDSIHGDLKPSQIMFARKDANAEGLKILGVGLAKVRSPEQPTTFLQGDTSDLLSSAPYMAPEQWRGTADERADVYSLGIILYQMLSGHVPFAGSSVQTIRENSLKPPPAPTPISPSGRFERLDEIVFRAIANDVAARPPSMKALIEELRKIQPPEEEPRRSVESPDRLETEVIDPELLNIWDNDHERREAYWRLEAERSERLSNDEQWSEPRYRDKSATTDPKKTLEEPACEMIQDPGKAMPAPITEERTSATGEPPNPKPLDENVQFTVYRPRAVEPEVWYSLFVYAHLAERRPDALESVPHPKEQVEKKAREALGKMFQAYSDNVTDSLQAIPLEGVLSFVAVFDGLEFVPDHHTLLWQGPVHELEFKMRAPRELEGQTARGHLRVYLGIILVAEISIAIRVNTDEAREFGEAPAAVENPVARYRKIFASYSHRDEAVVKQFEQLVEAFGDEYLRDVRDIRAGEKWEERLEELIREADIFQLFWSKNSMSSKFVQDEWEYALSLGKPNFIRPTFWEMPMPEDKSLGLPPAALLKLQFKRVPFYDEAVTKEEDNRKEIDRLLREIKESDRANTASVRTSDRAAELEQDWGVPGEDFEKLLGKIAAGNQGGTAPYTAQPQLPQQRWSPPSKPFPKWIFLIAAIAMVAALGGIVFLLWYLFS